MASRRGALKAPCVHCGCTDRKHGGHGLCTGCYQFLGCYDSSRKGEHRPIPPEERTFRREVFEGYKNMKTTVEDKLEDLRWMMAHGESVAGAAMRMNLSESRVLELLNTSTTESP